MTTLCSGPQHHVRVFQKKQHQVHDFSMDSSDQVRFLKHGVRCREKWSRTTAPDFSVAPIPRPVMYGEKRSAVSPPSHWRCIDNSSPCFYIAQEQPLHDYKEFLAQKMMRMSQNET